VTPPEKAKKNLLRRKKQKSLKKAPPRAVKMKKVAGGGGEIKRALAGERKFSAQKSRRDQLGNRGWKKVRGK